MIVRTLEEIHAAGRTKKAATGTWESSRYLVREDGMGFSFHYTTLYKGTSTFIWYKNHVEAVLCVKGSGELEEVENRGEEGKPGNKIHKITVGTMYALNGHEKHYLRASPDADLEVVCTFNPPVSGVEDHDERGVYAAIDDEGKQHFDLHAGLLPSLFVPPAVHQALAKAETPEEKVARLESELAAAKAALGK